MSERADVRPELVRQENDVNGAIKFRITFNHLVCPICQQDLVRDLDYKEHYWVCENTNCVENLAETRWRDNCEVVMVGKRT